MPDEDFGESVPYIELHPTNNCIFQCPWCTYLQFQGREHQTLDITLIDQVLALQPKFVMLCGGGDPSSYSTRVNDAPFRLCELLDHIRGIAPGAKLQIGTHAGFPDIPTDLLERFANAYHVGISLDAAYEASRGPRPGRANWDANSFRRSLQNIAKIVVARTEKGKSTYVSSTFTTENWVHLFRMARALFQELRATTEEPNALKVKFGCTSIADDSQPHDPYYPSRLGSSDKNNWALVRRLVRDLEPEFFAFIRDHTSLYKPVEDKTPTYGVFHCGMVKKYVLAAADGNYYPCCVMAARRSCSLGAIAECDPTSLAEKRQEFRENGTPSICADGCRIKKHTLMGKKAWS